MAGVSDVRVIEESRDAMANVLENGGTQKDFKRVVTRSSIARASQLTRHADRHRLPIEHHARLCKGRAEQLADPDVVAAMPYWQYRTAGDGRVRPAHAALDGFTALQSDFVWGRIYPPCGYNCRCTVIPLLASEAPEGCRHSRLAAHPGSPRLQFRTPASEVSRYEHSEHAEQPAELSADGNGRRCLRAEESR
jgi:SPP1 gp7 family putative phage head morphogenesis protein